MANLTRRQLLSGFGLLGGSVLAGLSVSCTQLRLTQPKAATVAAATPLPYKEVGAAARSTPVPTATPVASLVEATATPLVPTATALATDYGPATVTVWHRHPEWKNGGAAFGEAFRRTYPRITVKVLAQAGGIAKLRSALTAQDAADVLEVPERPDLDSIAAAKQLRDLTNVVDRSAWSKLTVGEVSVGGTIWAVPLGKYLVGIAYDLTAFKKAGVAKPPKVWGELSAAFAGLKKIDVIPQATAVKDGSLVYFTYMGLASAALGSAGFAALLDGSRSLSDADLVAVLAQIVAWSGDYQKKPAASTFLEARTLFATGQAASIVASTIDLAGYADVDASRKLGFLAWPAPDASGTSLANRGLSSLFGVRATTAVADAALAFVRWLGSAAGAQVALDDLSVLPALEGISPSNGSKVDALTRALLTIPSDVPVWQERHALVGLQPLWAKSGSALVAKSLSPTDFAKSLQAEVDQRRSNG